MNRHPHQNIFRPGLGVFDEHVEVAVVIEDARVDNSNSCRLLHLCAAVLRH